jgi:hypothetical protein
MLIAEADVESGNGRLIVLLLLEKAAAIVPVKRADLGTARSSIGAHYPLPDIRVWNSVEWKYDVID